VPVTDTQQYVQRPKRPAWTYSNHALEAFSDCKPPSYHLHAVIVRMRVAKVEPVLATAEQHTAGDVEGLIW